MPKHVLIMALAAASLALPAAAMAQNATTTEITVSKKGEYGAHLTDSQGRSVYLFEADKGKQGSTCSGKCAQAWPPVTTKGTQPSAGTGVQTEKLGTIKRKDGATQITYGGWPLYYFVKDQKPGDTKGQEVKGFGAEWYLVSPKGEKVESKS